MKKGEAIVAVEPCDDELDSLLDRSIHELNLSAHNFLHQSPYEKYFEEDQRVVFMTNKNHNKGSSSSSTPYMQEIDDHSSPETIRSKLISNVGTVREVTLIRRDSVISAVTFNEGGGQGIPFEDATINEGKTSATGESPNTEDSSYCFSSVKRRSSYMAEGRIRRRSISFNETVDRVTYEEGSWNMLLTNEQLEGSSDTEKIENNTRPSTVPSSASFRGLPSIEDDPSLNMCRKNTCFGFFKLGRRKHK